MAPGGGKNRPDRWSGWQFQCGRSRDLRSRGAVEGESDGPHRLVARTPIPRAARLSGRRAKPGAPAPDRLSGRLTTIPPRPRRTLTDLAAQSDTAALPARG